MLLFSYGSNNPEQLSDRLGRSGIAMRRAILPDYWRAFRGFSRRWGGGTATVIPHAGGEVYGYVAEVTASDLATMDHYEGVALGIYSRRTVTVLVGDRLQPTNAVVYVSNSREFNEPTRAYLGAIVETINAFWRSSGGRRVRIEDIPIR